MLNAKVVKVLMFAVVSLMLMLIMVPRFRSQCCILSCWVVVVSGS